MPAPTNAEKSKGKDGFRNTSPLSDFQRTSLCKTDLESISVLNLGLYPLFKVILACLHLTLQYFLNKSSTSESLFKAEQITSATKKVERNAIGREINSCDQSIQFFYITNRVFCPQQLFFLSQFRVYNLMKELLYNSNLKFYFFIILKWFQNNET